MAENKPISDEIAGIDNGRDITRGLFTDVMTPEDSIVLTKGAGDYKIYSEMLRDDQVHSTLQQRRMAITSRDWTVEPGGEGPQDKAAADFIRETLDSLNWDDISDKMHYGVYYGYAVAEAMWGTDGRFVTLDAVKIRKQRRFRWHKDGQLLLLTSSRPQGEDMPERKFWTFATGGDNSDNPYGLGLAHHLYWPVFFKRNGLKFWLIFLEKFGMPTIKGEYPGGWGLEKKKELLDALRSIQKDSAFIVPEGVSTDLLQAAGKGGGDYKAMQADMNASIAKVVLSQVMTAEAVGGQYKAEVQKDVRDEVVKGDADLINDSFCKQIATWLTEWNFPGAAIPKVSRDLSEDPDLNRTAERDSKIIELGYQPTQSYIDETYGEGWEPKVVQEPMNPNIDPDVLPAEFADLAAVLTGKISQRSNQQAIVEAAKKAALRYPEIMGARVAQLVGFLEDSNDLQTFSKHLNELLEDMPDPQTIEEIEKTTVMSRLLGMFKGQRR